MKYFFDLLVINLTVVIGVVLIEELVEISEVWGRAGFHFQSELKIL
jgi:hypothetical protein